MNGRSNILDLWFFATLQIIYWLFMKVVKYQVSGLTVEFSFN